MNTPRTLVISRHATAESFSDDDHSRRLTRRGEGEALALGTALAPLVPTVDAALVSDARRTLDTWKLLGDGVAGAGRAWQAAVDVTRGVYTADEHSLLQLLREVDEEATTVVVVGHNPTVASLALLLEDGEGDNQVALAISRGFEPASAAVFSVQGDWAGLAFGGATLRAFLSGRS